MADKRPAQRRQSDQLLDTPLAQYQNHREGGKNTIKLRRFLCLSLALAGWLFVKGFKGSTTNDNHVNDKTFGAVSSLEWSWSSVRLSMHETNPKLMHN